MHNWTKENFFGVSLPSFSQTVKSEDITRWYMQKANNQRLVSV